VRQALAEQGALPRSAVFAVRWSTQHHSSSHTRPPWPQRSRFCSFWGTQIFVLVSLSVLFIFLSVALVVGIQCVFGQGCSWGPSTLAVPLSRYPERGGRHERRGSPAGPQCPSSIDCFMLPVGHFSAGCGDSGCSFGRWERRPRLSHVFAASSRKVTNWKHEAIN